MCISKLYYYRVHSSRIVSSVTCTETILSNPKLLTGFQLSLAKFSWQINFDSNQFNILTPSSNRTSSALYKECLIIQKLVHDMSHV